MLDILSGDFEPSALLPIQMPANMRTVEEQMEDVPHVETHRDVSGNSYGFGFGLNWQGVIDDVRNKKVYRTEKTLK